MQHLEEIRVFVEVIKQGNFTSAATSLGISKQLVSRRVMSLEARLQARLLLRTTRKLSPTETGKLYYQRCQAILQALHDAEQEIGNQSQELRGMLRISAPLSYASMVMSPALNAFMLQHPHVEVQLDADNRSVDVVGEGFDLVIRITMHPDEGMVAKKLADAPLVYCCSPAYAEHYGVPNTPLELKSHRLISTRHAWMFKEQGELRKYPIHPVLLSNHGEVLRDAALAGVGIAFLPSFYIQEALRQGRLMAILQPYQMDMGAVYAMYPYHRQGSATVKAFINHFSAWLAQVD